MATNQFFTKNEESKLRERLEKLSGEKQVMLAARCALRAFPLLAYTSESEKPFSYWREKERTKHLLAVWEANINVFCNNFTASNTVTEINNRAAQAAQAASNKSALGKATLGSSNLAGSTFSVSSIANAAAFASSDTLQTVISSTDAYINISKEHPYLPDFKQEIWKDLELLDYSNVEDFGYKPLWEKPNNEFLNWLNNECQQAFFTQAQQQEEDSSNAFHILNEIWSIYSAIYNGQSIWNDLKDTLQRLNLYFNPTYTKTIAGHRHSSYQATNEDTLNRQHLADSIATLIAHPKNTQHQTIGLLGHWGIGKTTVIELLKASLSKPDIDSNIEFLFAEFNAWGYEHTDNLQAGVAQEMINTLSSPEPATTYWEKVENNRNIKDKRTPWKTLCWLWRKPILILRFAWRLHGTKMLSPLLPLLLATLPALFLVLFNKTLEELTQSIAYIFSAVWLVGLLVPTWKKTKTLLAGPRAKELLTYLKLPDYGQHLGTIPVMRKHIKKLTEVRLKDNQRLLYVVDDLDRCGPEGIVKVMEAVRMVLDLDKVVVVIAVDQQIALSALALNYKDLASQHQIQNPRIIARDYLSKIIQLSIMLTKPDEASISGYLNKMWNDTSTQEETDDNRGVHQNVKKPTTTEERRQEAANISEEVKKSEEDFRTQENLDDTPTTNKPIRQVEGLTLEQKTAFLHWVKHFELSNPRQLKRLNNTYNFLRNFYGEDEMQQSYKARHYPMLVTLCALEYLNNLNDLPMKTSLYQQLIEGGTKRLDKKMTILVGDLTRKKLLNTTMLKAIEPFVLPGIESIKPVEAEK